jgi:hypothetical protein
MNDDHTSGPPARVPGEELSENQHPMVPFSIDLGISTVQGILSIHDKSLRLEWRIYDLLDAPKGSMQSVDLPIDRIEDIVLKHRLIGSRLTLVRKSAKDLEEFPLPAGSLNELKCSVKRKHRSSAELWAAELLMRLAEQA